MTYTKEEKAEAQRQNAIKYYHAHREQILAKIKQKKEKFKENHGFTPAQVYYYNHKDQINARRNYKYQEQKQQLMRNQIQLEIIEE